MSKFVIGPGGVYFPLDDAIIVVVEGVNDGEFTNRMDNESVDEAWNLVIDSVPGGDVDDYIPWGDQYGRND